MIERVGLRVRLLLPGKSVAALNLDVGIFIVAIKKIKKTFLQSQIFGAG